MAIAYELLDENSGFVAEVPVVIPLHWRTKTSYTNILGGAGSDLPTNDPNPNLPGSSVTYGAWMDGGTAGANRRVCKWQNGSGFFLRKEWAVLYRPVPSLGTYVSVSAAIAYEFTDTNMEIDWEATLAAVRASYNPQFYAIGAIRFTDAAGENPVDLVKEGLVSLDSINSVFRNTDHEGEIVAKDLLNMTLQGNYSTQTRPYGPGPVNAGELIEFEGLDSMTENGIAEGEDGATWNQYLQDNVFNSSNINFCVDNGRSIPMYIKIWVSQVVATSGTVSWKDPDDTQQYLEGDAGETDPSGRGSSGVGGSFGGSTLGSSAQGLNTIGTLFGNSNLPFNSVFLTGSNYNSFVTGGGGIVTESGVFPNNTAFYIDKVRLTIEGSTMTVIEVKKFDESPSLSINEKIYGYVFDDNHSSKPGFAGFVTSRRRKLSGDTQEITYECRDASYYFDQLFSPSFYIYRPPSTGGSGATKTYDRVLKEILNVAGLPDAIVNIPTLSSPGVEWVYEPLSNVLEWATKYFGKYVSYIDRYGRLNVRAKDSGSFLKNIPIPAEGTPVGTSYKVMEYEPITDASRSRSRVILTGDFELDERLFKGKFTPQGPINPADANKTGMYWYYQTVSTYGATRFFYFVFKTSSNLLDKLLSDPSKNCEVTITIKTPLNGVAFTPGLVATSTATLPIWFFQNDLGNGKIIAKVDLSAFGNGSILPLELTTGLPGLSNPTPVEYNFEVRYAVKSNAPIQVQVDTGLTGGTEVIKRPEFKKISGGENAINDLALMAQYLTQIQEFYKTTEGGKILLEGLDLDLELLGKVSLTGTSLPSSESSNLIIYEIEYNVPKKLTTIDVSNRVYEDLPFFDVVRERNRGSNETLVKLGLMEQSTLYNKR